MNKLTIMLLALTVTCGSVFAASANFSISSKPYKSHSHHFQVINICQMTDPTLNEVILGLHPDIAVEFSAQTIIPMSFFLKGDLVHLIGNQDNCGAVEVKQTFYARCVQQVLLLSTDLNERKPFLEFITGKTSVSLNIQDGKPSLVVGAEAYQRF